MSLPEILPLSTETISVPVVGLGEMMAFVLPTPKEFAAAAVMLPFDFLHLCEVELASCATAVFCYTRYVLTVQIIFVPLNLIWNVVLSPGSNTCGSVPTEDVTPGPDK